MRDATLGGRPASVRDCLLMLQRAMLEHGPFDARVADVDEEHHG